MGDLKTNILYITTKCNLDCDYCYERDARNSDGFVHKTITNEEIDFFVNEVCEREKGFRSSVVIFGGEPMLYPDKVKYLIDKFIEKKVKSSVVNFDLITNGTTITEPIAAFFAEYQKLLKSHGSSLQVEISYDGIGQKRRVYYSGKDSTPVLNETFNKLNSAGVKFAISYTVHSLNINNVVKDLLYCIIKLNTTKIVLRQAKQELEEAGHDVDKFNEYLLPRIEAIFNKYKVPICEYACRVCGNCSKTLLDNNYYVPSSGQLKIDAYTQKQFDHF